MTTTYNITSGFQTRGLAGTVAESTVDESIVDESIVHESTVDESPSLSPCTPLLEGRQDNYFLTSFHAAESLVLCLIPLTPVHHHAPVKVSTTPQGRATESRHNPSLCFLHPAPPPSLHQPINHWPAHQALLASEANTPTPQRDNVPGLLGDVRCHRIVQVPCPAIITILGPLDQCLQVHVVIISKVPGLLAIFIKPEKKKKYEPRSKT